MIPLNGMKKKGLDPLTDYDGVVVDNNDPMQIGQCRIRVMGIMDDIQDQDIPWSRPNMQQLEGIKGGEQGNIFGTMFIPQRGGRVTVRYPTARLDDSEYFCVARPTEQDTLPEFKMNYPHRIGVRLSNGTQLIIDRSTDEVFLNLAGEYHFTVMGNVNQTIIGNMQQVIGSGKGDIPDYIKGDPTLTPNSMSPKGKGRVRFKGDSKGSAGNMFTHVKGHRKTIIDGNDTTIVKGISRTTARDWEVDSAGDAIVNGQTVMLN